MALSESFTSGLGTILGVQLVPISGVTSLFVVDMAISQTNISPERNGWLLVLVDGHLYRINFIFNDETYDYRTLEGYSKKRNPNATTK